MKKLGLLLVFVLPMAIYHAYSQEVTITLYPGWTWISYPRADTMNVTTAFATIPPVDGDLIMAQDGFSVYMYGEWYGAVHQLIPGKGLKYKSLRSEDVSYVFGSSIQLTVTTDTVSAISGSSALGGGSVALEGNSFVLMKGICWATHPNPNANDDFHSENGTGTGSFTASMNNLEVNTIYYVRAYAVTASGVTYGEERTFTTRNGIPVVTTALVTNIFEDGATCVGSVLDDGGLEITAKGVCWSTVPNPTIIDDHTSEGVGAGEFISVMTGLSNNTTYYVRAYAINNDTILYGNEESFTTAQIWDNGILPGAFSINDSVQVYFSQGNLQYIGSADTPYWRFATHQWNCLGLTTGQNSNDENVDRDLFGWGTSGYHDENDSFNVNYQPWSTSRVTVNSNCNYYGYGPSTNMPSPDLTDSSENYDWGVYNAISNGGDQPNQWRTLTGNEWDYLFNVRNADTIMRYARGCVNGTNGIILLPDNWDSSVYVLNYANNVEAVYESNVISADDWTNILETNGAVFLPAAGVRVGISVGNVGSYAIYWSTTHANGNGNANNVYSIPSILNPFSNYIRCNGIAVRLVCPAQ